MTPTPAPAPTATSPRPLLAWAWLVLALAWVGVARVPLVLNAGAHLDSDLAVDGLTLLDAANGHWRWHYPATPFIGSPPVALSWLQAKIWGANPMTLVSGGVVAYALVVLATFLLNRRAFGPSAANWGLVPLAFASTGTIWLSGRVTGGHLLAAAWHAGAFAILRGVLTKGGWRRSAGLGLWCGLGLYVDSMFAVTCLGVGVAVAIWWVSSWVHSSSPLPPGEGPGVRDVASQKAPELARETADRPATSLTPTLSQGEREAGGKASKIVGLVACLLAFGLATGVGIAPRFVGARVDPHNAYEGQLEPDIRLDRIKQNGWILVKDCLPRLITGHRLPGLQSEPKPSSLIGGTAPTRAEGILWVPGQANAKLSGPAQAEGIPWFALTLTVFSLYLFGRAMVALGWPLKGGDPVRVAIRWGLLASALAVVAGFLVNRTIANSDNYRYLVTLLIPWSTGFGLMMDRVGSRRRFGHCENIALAVAFAALMTCDSRNWYARFGWLDGVRPVRKAVDDPALAWLEGHPEVSSIWGDYWDVYRLSFLTGGRVRGVPFPEYPERFPEIKQALPGGRPRVVIVGPKGLGPRYEARALIQGGREIGRASGLSIVDWPTGVRP